MTTRIHDVLTAASVIILPVSFVALLKATSEGEVIFWAFTFVFAPFLAAYMPLE